MILFTYIHDLFLFVLNPISDVGICISIILILVILTTATIFAYFCYKTFHGSTFILAFTMSVMYVIKSVATVATIFAARTSVLPGVFNISLLDWHGVLQKLEHTKLLLTPLIEVNDYLHFGYAFIRYRAIHSSQFDKKSDSKKVIAFIIFSIVLKYAAASFDIIAGLSPFDLHTGPVFYFHFIMEHTFMIAIFSSHIYFVHSTMSMKFQRIRSNYKLQLEVENSARFGEVKFH